MHLQYSVERKSFFSFWSTLELNQLDPIDVQLLAKRWLQHWLGGLSVGCAPAVYKPFSILCVQCSFHLSGSKCKITASTSRRVTAKLGLLSDSTVFCGYAGIPPSACCKQDAKFL